MGFTAEDKHNPVMMEFRVIKNRLDGDVERFYLSYVPGWSYRDYLVRLGVDLVGAYVVEKGRRKGLSSVPSEPCIVFVCYDVGVSAVAGVVKAFFALSWVKAVGTALMWAGVAYSVYSAFQKPKMPSFGSIGEGLDEGSPTYGWDGISTTQDVGLPVPVVYGEHKVGGNIINQYIWEDGSKSYLNVLLGLCEGEIESISEIKINDNPIENYTGVEVYTRLGTNDQDVIPTFGDIHHNNSLNVQLLNGISYAYTTVRSDVEAFELHLRLPNGLFQQDDSGAIRSWDVDYKVEYKKTTDLVWTDLGVFTITGKTRSAVRRVFRKDGLEPAKYDIRITRVSDDSDFYKVGDLYLVNVDEITTEDLAYPNTALLGLRMLASDQLSGSMPTISCVVRGRKVRVPIVKDDLGNEVPWEDYYWDSTSGAWKRFSDGATLSWDGVSWGDRWCANPIWCLRDLFTNERYGLGRYIDSSVIDDDFLMEMAKYCDEGVDDGNGGLEKRFRLDVVIDSFTKALDLIIQLCATFRGMPLYGEGGIKLLIDKTDNPVQVFGMGNIVADTFSESWKSKNEAPNWIEVMFSNKDKDYEQDIVCVVDEDAIANGEPIRKKQIRMYATRVSQAIRLGKYMLEVGKRIDRTISFRTSVEGVTLQPGDVFLFSHDVPQWGESGRVVEGTLSSVTLDKDVIIEAGKSYRVVVRFSDDSIEERDVTNLAGTTNVLTVTPDFTQVPSKYDVWAFGEVNKVSKPFRCISMSRTGQGEVEITGLEYDEGVYVDESVVIPEDKYSMLSLDIPDVEDLTLTERLVKLKDGTIENAIDVWFRKPIRADYFIKQYAKAKIYISDDNGVSWIFRGETTGDHFAIQGGIKDLITYKVAVVSVSEKGEENSIEDSPQAEITVIGKSAPPADVVGFNAKKDGDEIVFSWSPNPDVDLKGYEIREGDSWDRGTIVATDIKGTEYRLPIFTFGEKRYMIKAIDTSGNYSNDEAYQVVEVTDAINIEFLQDDDLDVFSEGYLETSGALSELVVTNSGEQVEDSVGEDVYQSPLYGFVKKTQADYVDLVDSNGVLVTTNIGEPIYASVVYTDFLELKYFENHYASEGIYRTKIVDLGTKVRARLSMLINVEGDDCVYEVYINTSDDGVTWSGWSVFASGEYECRYFEIKVVVKTNDTSLFARLWNLKSRATVRYTEDGGEDIEVVQTANISFSKTFYVKVKVFVMAQGSAYARVTSKDLSGFSVAVYDETGAPTTAKIDWFAKGY